MGLGVADVSGGLSAAVSLVPWAVAATIARAEGDHPPSFSSELGPFGLQRLLAFGNKTISAGNASWKVALPLVLRPWKKVFALFDSQGAPPHSQGTATPFSCCCCHSSPQSMLCPQLEKLSLKAELPQVGHCS